MHIMVIIGTRPEAIKMAPVIRALRGRPDIKLTVCNTQQHVELVDQALGVFNLRADISLNIMEPGQTPARVAAAVMTRMSEIFETEKPDWLLVQGDTATCFAAGLAGFYHRIRVAHIEAGLRSFDRENPWPEETNRRMVSAYADHHFAPTAQNARNLIAEGIPTSSITVCGNTVIDALAYGRDLIARNATLRQSLESRLGLAERDGFNNVLVTVHRRENHGQPLADICRALSRLAEEPHTRILFPVHPTPAIRAAVHARLHGHPRIELLPPLGYLEMICALMHSTLVLTDSGGIQEEAPAFDVPVLILRETTERMEAVTAGAARLIGTSKGEIVKNVTQLLARGEDYKAMRGHAGIFGNGTAGEQIVGKLIQLERKAMPAPARQAAAS